MGVLVGRVELVVEQSRGLEVGQALLGLAQALPDPGPGGQRLRVTGVILERAVGQRQGLVGTSEID
ncbi:MAG: hypothetical protein A2516_07365 [Alphaproteobacteria bacterium RIFOXYD12_FULL_60_8]|nr:MAG: hypothetical protein A2516_07365 [Alphaproteobacteria bacterium RIFOXYD12_FULL_60_8]